MKGEGALPRAIACKVRLVLVLVLLTTILMPGTSFAADQNWAQQRIQAARNEISFHFTVFTTAISNAVITYGQNNSQPAGVREQRAAGAFVATVVVAEQARMWTWLFRAD